MFNGNNSDRNALAEFYKTLNLTEAQQKVLSSFSYDNRRLVDAILAYHTSKDYHNKLSFCESIVNFAGDRELNEDILREYTDKFSDKKEIKDEQSILFGDNGGYSFGGFRGCGFGISSDGSGLPDFAGPGFGKTFNSAPQPKQSKLSNMVGAVRSAIRLSSKTVEPVPEDDSFDDNECDYCDCVESVPDTDSFDDSEYDYCDCDESVETASVNCMNMCNTSSVERSVDRTSNFILDSIRTDRYEHIDEKNFKNVLNNPTSTFRTTCNNASLNLIKKNIKFGFSVDASMVRIEELLNYFNYNLENKTDEKFTIQAELSNKPYSKNKMLYVGVKGNENIPGRQNVVILLDVSGSMGGYKKNTQAAIIAMVSKLNVGDKLSLITYSSDDKVVIDDITIKEDSMDYIIERLLQVEIFGCTWGSKGLNTAYELIDRNKIENGINRVVIITDGDFNFGDSRIDKIEKLILEKKKTGAYLSVIGTGTLNTNDELMNTLAKNGNGNYCYIDSIEDVAENIRDNYNKLMFSIAKDVKAQIEFNPKYVKSYRLIGYENREISHEDFKNDKVIAEPFGSGAHAVAVYELEMTDETEIKSDLKYQKPVVIESNNLCTVSVRYKELDEDTSKEISKDIEFNIVDMGYNSKLAYIIYILGEKLRKSDFITDKDVKSAALVLDELMEVDEINKEKMEILNVLASA